MMRLARKTVFFCLLAASQLVRPAMAGEPAYRIAPFSADVTIPLGHRCMGILPTKAQTIDDPLEANGFVLLGPGNDGSGPIRQVLADRIYEAMKRAWEATERFPLKRIAFRSAPLQLPFHEGPEFGRGALETVLRDERANTSQRILAAMGLSSLDRIARGQPIDVPCLDLGRAKIVLFPGEAFVGYQLMAQRMSLDSFVLSIGYGECWPGYIPTQAAFDDRFNHDWRWADPESEGRIRHVLETVLHEKK